MHLFLWEACMLLQLCDFILRYLLFRCCCWLRRRRQRKRAIGSDFVVFIIEGAYQWLACFSECKNVFMFSTRRLTSITPPSNLSIKIKQLFTDQAAHSKSKGQLPIHTQSHTVRQCQSCWIGRRIGWCWWLWRCGGGGRSSSVVGRSGRSEEGCSHTVNLLTPCNEESN